MKKLLLLLAAGATGFGAQAQSSVVFNANQSAVKPTELPAGMTKARLNAEFQRQRLERINQSQASANKGSRTGSRTYNYVDLLITQTPTTADNDGFPYFWGTGFNAFASYTSGYDTINFASLGQVIQPAYNKWNSPFAFPNELAIEPDATYRLDTVKIYGIYQRNQNKPNVNDTMLVSIFYGNGSSGSNVEFRSSLRSAANSIAAEYGVDTLKFDLVPLDTVRYIARVGASAPANSMIQKAVVLTRNRDTTIGGLDIIRVPVGLNVPAGNVVGVTYTFKTGDPAFTPYDTALVAAGANMITPKFNIFRPHVFEQNVGAYPTYYADNNFNNGMFKLFPIAPGDFFYLPMYFFTPPSGSEFPNVDFVISSTQFNNVGVKNTNSLIASASIYPSPANTQVTIPVTVTEAANVSVSITNTAGQIIKTQNLGKVSANNSVNAVFSTVEMPSGIYFYTVNADGQRITNRFVVAH